MICRASKACSLDDGREGLQLCKFRSPHYASIAK
jgi:hypothetical protein